MGVASRLFCGPLLLALLGIAPPDLSTRLGQLATRAHHPARAHFIAERTETYERRTYLDRIETQGMQRLSHRCSQAVCRGTYFDGTRTFTLSYNDAAFPEGDADNATSRTLRAIDSLAFTEPGFTRSGGSVSDEPQQNDGLARFRVSGPGGRPLSVALDPRSGRVERIDDETRPLVIYRDYRDVGDVAFAYERTVGSEKFTYDRVTRGVGDITPPSGLAITTATQATEALDDPGPTPRFRCSLAGIDFTCVLDTGTVGMAIGLAAAERLHLEPSGEIDVAGLGHYVSGLVRAGPLVLPGARIAEARFIVLPDFRAADIIVGGDALAALRATIDYAHHTIGFAPNGAESAAATLAIAFRGLRPYVDVELAGERAALELDTGDDSAIDLGYAYYRTRPSLFTLESRGNTRGIGATSDRFGGTMHDVRVGPFHFTTVAAIVTRALRERGHLGAKLLERFTVILDYAHERVELVPRSDRDAPK